MSSIKRKYVSKRTNEPKVYIYTKNQDTPAKIKRDHLIQFIQIHQDELNDIPKKKDKIQWIRDNIDDTYSYSDSMIYRHISKSKHKTEPNMIDGEEE